MSRPPAGLQPRVDPRTQRDHRHRLNSIAKLLHLQSLYGYHNARARLIESRPTGRRTMDTKLRWPWPPCAGYPWSWLRMRAKDGIRQ